MLDADINDKSGWRQVPISNERPRVNTKRKMVWWSGLNIWWSGLISKALFEELVVLKIKMDLVETVVEGGELMEDRFHILTEPRSAGTGLRYARLLKRYVDAYQEHGDPEKAPQDLFSEGFMQKFILQLISDGSGFRTPQSLVYAIEHFGGVFGFETPGPRHARIRKMANDYSAKAPERNPAPLFEVGMLEYLEGVVLDSGRDLQTRVACGKLRVCIQASVRHSDLGGTSMSVSAGWTYRDFGVEGKGRLHQKRSQTLGCRVGGGLC